MAGEVEATQTPEIGAGARRNFAPWADPAARALVRFDAVTKRFADTLAVDALSLDIFPGEFFALLGPSGCGKSTLLRLLAGLETPSAGRVLLDGAAIDGVPPHRRPVNMMFQNYALFPHLTVERNVAFGLKQERRPRAEIAARVGEMLGLVKLAPLAKRRPHELSGGERQRVALARSLVKRPRVLLLDEPLAALDKQLRGETQFELMELQARLGTAFVIVTHDQEEAMTVAHRMAVMDRGRIVQVGTPAEIYEQPNSRYVASFVGDVNLIEGRLAATGPSGSVIDSGAGIKLAASQRVDAAAGATVWLALRPEKLRVATVPPAVSENCVAGRVAEIAYLGNVSVYKVSLDTGLIMKAQLPNLTRVVERPIATNERVWLSWTPDAGVVLTG
jgi:putrescine transport system ATP-binding protein